MPTNSIEYKDDGIYYNGKLIPDIGSQTEKTSLDDNDIILLEDSADSNNKKKITKSNFTSSLVAGTDGQVQFNDSGSFGASADLFWDKTNGRLGVGTQTPDRRLSVEDASGNSIMRFDRESNLSHFSISNLTSDDSVVSLGNSDRSWQLRARSGGFFTLSDATIIENRLTIDSAGKVGIGTSTPNTTLDIVNTTVSNPDDHTWEFNSLDEALSVRVGGSPYGAETGLNFGTSGAEARTVASIWAKSWGAGYGNGRLAFRTSNADVQETRMVIDEVGNVGIGTNSPDYKLHVAGVGVVANENSDIIRMGSRSDSILDIIGKSNKRGITAHIDNIIDQPGLLGLYSNNGVTYPVRFFVDYNGVVSAPTVYSTTVGATNRDLFIDSTGKLGYVASSQRYKENIQDLSDVNWIHNLRPVTFDYINKEQGVDKTGLIAEEVEKVNPKLVSYNQDNQPETVLYSELVTPLLKQVQEQEKKLSNQQALIEKQETAINNLLERIKILETK